MKIRICFLFAFLLPITAVRATMSFGPENLLTNRSTRTAASSQRTDSLPGIVIPYQYRVQVATGDINSDGLEVIINAQSGPVYGQYQFRARGRFTVVASQVPPGVSFAPGSTGTCFITCGDIICTRDLIEDLENGTLENGITLTNAYISSLKFPNHQGIIAILIGFMSIEIYSE